VATPREYETAVVSRNVFCMIEQVWRSGPRCSACTNGVLFSGTSLYAQTPTSPDQIGTAVTQLFMVHPGPLSTVVVPALDEGYVLRLAGNADIDELADVLSESYGEPWDTARVKSELMDAPDVVATWVASDSQGIVAVASERLLPSQYPDAGYVHWVGVLPRARGHRLGALVTAQCMIGFAERGLSTVVLETDDFRVPAVITYLRLGFVPSYRSVEEQQAWSTLFPNLLGGQS
jgi:mycothiol synthase